MALVSSKRSVAARRKRSQKKKAKRARENTRQSPYLKHQPCVPDVYDDYVDIADDDRVDSDPEVYDDRDDIDDDDRVESDWDDCDDIDHDDRRIDSNPEVYDDCLAIDCEMICVLDPIRPMELASVALVNHKGKVVYNKILRPPPAHLINWKSRRYCPITSQEFEIALRTEGTTFDEVRQEVLKRLKRLVIDQTVLLGFSK